MDEGNPVVTIIPDPARPKCVLVARALAHMMITDGELMRACHDSSEKIITKEAVWSIAGRNPILIAFSNDVGELQGSTVANRHAYPAFDQSVAGMHFAKLGDVVLISSGITQSVSLSGPVPILVEWKD